MSDSARHDLREVDSVAPRVRPVPVPLGRIFSVPGPARVGTLDIGNSLCHLSLTSPLGIDIMATDYADPVSLGVEIFPSIARSVCYASRRLLYRLDPSALVMQSYILVASLRERTHAFDALGGEGERFFAALRQSSFIEPPLRVIVFELVQSEIRVLGEVTCPLGSRFAAHAGGLSIIERRVARSYDETLRPQPHPIEAALRDLPWSGGPSSHVDALRMHPSTGCAYLIERTPIDSVLWLIDWRDLGDIRATCLVRAPLIWNMAISRDCAWLSFQCSSPEAIYLMPATPDSLRAPIRLAVPSESGPVSSSAWTEGPTSMVGCAGSSLYHWVPSASE